MIYALLIGGMLGAFILGILAGRLELDPAGRHARTAPPDRPGRGAPSPVALPGRSSHPSAPRLAGAPGAPLIWDYGLTRDPGTGQWQWDAAPPRLEPVTVGGVSDDSFIGGIQAWGDQVCETINSGQWPMSATAG